MLNEWKYEKTKKEIRGKIKRKTIDEAKVMNKKEEERKDKMKREWRKLGTTKSGIKTEKKRKYEQMKQLTKERIKNCY